MGEASAWPKEGIAFTALDNGILWCENPQRLQPLCEELDAEKIEAVFRKWLARLPHPFRPEDRQAGYRYALSILQAELSLTQVLDRPQTGRQFFAEVIRENLDLGRPDRVQLIFGRKLTRRTPGSFRTRVALRRRGPLPARPLRALQDQAVPQGRTGATLPKTTLNDTYDCGIGRRLCNLPAARGR